MNGKRAKQLRRHARGLGMSPRIYRKLKRTVAGLAPKDKDRLLTRLDFAVRGLVDEGEE